MTTPRTGRTLSVLHGGGGQPTHTPRASSRSQSRSQFPSMSPTRCPTPSGERESSSQRGNGNAAAARERIHVYVRPRATADAAQIGVEIEPSGPSGSTALTIRYGEQCKSLACDGAFHATDSQERVYAAVAPRVLDAVVSRGLPACIFAYGQTGSGKTFTMSQSGPTEQRGLIPRLLEDVFERLEHECAANQRSYTASVEYLEIENEVIKDLLVGGPQSPSSAASSFAQPTLARPLEIATAGRVHVPGLTKVAVSSSADALQLLEQGQSVRKVVATGMNKLSSRSHAIFTLSIEMSDLLGDAAGPTTFARLNLVDLAGSESQKSVVTEGEVRKQGNAINQSLSMLSLVIQELQRGQAVPSFRNSKLTHLLKDSLSAGVTTLIATIHTSARELHNTLSTLNFAERAQSIRLDAQRQVVSGLANMDSQSLRRKCEEMQRENARLRNQVAQHTQQQQLQQTAMMQPFQSVLPDLDCSYDPRVSLARSFIAASPSASEAARHMTSPLPSPSRAAAVVSTMPSPTRPLPARPSTAMNISATMPLPLDLQKQLAELQLRKEGELVQKHMQTVHALEADKRALRAEVVSLQASLSEAQELMASESKEADTLLTQYHSDLKHALESADRLRDENVQLLSRLADAESLAGMSNGASGSDGMVSALQERVATLESENEALSKGLSSLEMDFMLSIVKTDETNHENAELKQRVHELEAQLREAIMNRGGQQQEEQGLVSPLTLKEKLRQQRERMKSPQQQQARAALAEQQSPLTMLQSQPLAASQLQNASQMATATPSKQLGTSRLSQLFDCEKAARVSMGFSAPHAHGRPSGVFFSPPDASVCERQADVESAFAGSPALLRAHGALFTDENECAAAPFTPLAKRMSNGHGQASARQSMHSPRLYVGDAAASGMQALSPQQMEIIARRLSVSRQMRA